MSRPEKPAMTRQEKQKLYDLVKRIDLLEFVRRESGRDVVDCGRSWKMVCPMPSHKDTDPSFHIYKHNGQWFYRCYGCDSKGTIIDFCVDFFSMDHPSEALLYVLNKHGIKSDIDFMAKAVKEARVETDRKKKLESAHFVSATNCRNLLRRYNGNSSIQSMVAQTYMDMNKMLENNDVRGIEAVSEKVSHILAYGLEESAQ